MRTIGSRAHRNGGSQAWKMRRKDWRKSTKSLINGRTSSHKMRPSRCPRSSTILSGESEYVYKRLWVLSSSEEYCLLAVLPKASLWMDCCHVVSRSCVRGCVVIFDRNVRCTTQRSFVGNDHHLYLSWPPRKCFVFFRWPSRGRCWGFVLYINIYLHGTTPGPNSTPV